MNLAARITEVSRVLLAFLGLNLVLVNAMLPFLVFALFTDALAGLPVPLIVAVGAGAWALSGPGLAAAFATYRDAHLMRFGESHEARDAWARVAPSSTAIAASYWRDRDDSRIVRPFVRAYVRLFRRSFVVSAVFGAVVAGLLIAALTMLRAMPELGEPLAAVLAAVTAFALVSGLVALSLVVGLPRARTAAVVRSAVLLTARRPLLAGLSLVVLGVYGYVLLAWPLLIITVASGLIFFFSSHVSHAIAVPVFDAIAAEEHETRGRALTPNPSTT